MFRCSVEFPHTPAKQSVVARFERKADCESVDPAPEGGGPLIGSRAGAERGGQFHAQSRTLARIVRRTKAVLEFLKEAKIEINFLVFRTVEGTDGRARWSIVAEFCPHLPEHRST